MKSLIKYIFRNRFALKIRNSFNIRPIPIYTENLERCSVSDCFAWRTDKNFKTCFKYSDILNLFFKIKNSYVEFIFFDKQNKLIKKHRVNNLDYSNELHIDSEFLGGLNDYGTFYVHHYTDQEINNNDVIANKCYIGYAIDKQLHSFVHGNILAHFQNFKAKNINENSDLVTTSIFKNQNYKIAKTFDDYDKNELFFSNPTSKILNISIDEINFFLNPNHSKIIDIGSRNVVNIKSNCLILRPTIFSYKKNYLDVHHS